MGQYKSHFELKKKQQKCLKNHHCKSDFLQKHMKNSRKLSI